MPKGIEIGIASETKAFKQGVETGIIAPVENAVEALDNLGKSKGPDQLEQGLEDAQDATKRLSREVKDTADDIEREFKQAYRGMKNNADSALDRGREGFRNFKQEAVQNVGEVASSFSGDLTQAVDGVQGTLGGLAAALSGPAAVAAAGAAVGVGFITQGLVDAQKEADTLKERLTTAYQAAVDGGRATLDENQIIAASNEIIFDPTQRKQYQKDAATIGVDATTLIRAMSGDEAALNDVLATGVALRDNQKTKTEGLVGAQGEAISAYDAELTNIESIVQKLQAQKATQEDIKQGVALAQQLRGEDFETIQKTNKALADTPRTITTKLNVDTSALDAIERIPRSLMVTLNLQDRYGRGIV